MTKYFTVTEIHVTMLKLGFTRIHKRNNTLIFNVVVRTIQIHSNIFEPLDPMVYRVG